MIPSLGKPSGVYCPSRLMGGLGAATPELFLVEGNTDFDWVEAGQQQVQYVPEEPAESLWQEQTESIQP